MRFKVIIFDYEIKERIIEIHNFEQGSKCWYYDCEIN